MNVPFDDALEVETASDPDAAVVWLHGLGADGHDFLPIVPELGLPSELGVRFVFPHAPRRPITINGGMVMRGWYDIRGMDIGADPDAEGIAESAALVSELIEREHRRGIDFGRIVLAGFSQGGAIALYAAPPFRRRIAGVIALSTYLPLAEASDERVGEANRGASVFMAHGRHDPIIALGLARESRARLEAQGFDVEWHEYPIPHSVSPEEINHLGAWLSARLG